MFRHKKSTPHICLLNVFSHNFQRACKYVFLLNFSSAHPPRKVDGFRCRLKVKIISYPFNKNKQNVLISYLVHWENEDQREGVVGAIICDHSGEFIAPTSEKMSFCFDAFTPKATTVRFRLNLARIVGCNKVELEFNNAEVVSALQEGRLSSVT